MTQTKLVLALGLVVVLGIVFQVMFVFADIQDSPSKAAVAFAKAYYAVSEECMSDRYCQSGLEAEAGNPVDAYVYEATQKARSRGYDVNIYIKNRLYHVETETLEATHDQAKVRLTAERKSPLRTFFSKGDIHPVDATFDLVKEDGKWKVCGTTLFESGI